MRGGPTAGQLESPLLGSTFGISSTQRPQQAQSRPFKSQNPMGKRESREPTGLCRLVRWEPPSTGIPVVPGPRRSGLPSLESPHEGTVRAFGSSTLKNPTEKTAFSKEKTEAPRRSRKGGPVVRRVQ